jgi:ATP phosphoribosyltransferase
MTLRIVVPDGPLRAPSFELLAAAGAVEGITSLAAADLPSYLLLGAADVGLVAKDVLLERASGLCELLDLRFGGAVLVYAIAPGAAARAHRLGRLRIATRHPVLTRAYFAAQGVHVAVVEVAGSLERAATDGLADGVVALVDAPSHAAPDDLTDAAPEDLTDAVRPRIAGLTVEGVVATSSVRLVCGRGARVLYTAELGALVARLRDLTVTKEPT